MNRARTDSDLLSLVPVGSPRHNLGGLSPTRRGPFKRSESGRVINQRERRVAVLKRLDTKTRVHVDFCYYLLTNSPPPSRPRTLSSGRLSNMLLKAAYGSELFEMGSDESLNSEKSMDATGKGRTNWTNWSARVLVSNGAKTLL